MSWKIDKPSKKKVRAITAWSNSRLDVFRTCSHWAELKFIDKVPENPRPDTGKEQANDRGSRVHKAAEDYVLGNTDIIIPEMKSFEAEFLKLRTLREQDESSVVCENGWAFDNGWNVVPYDPEDYPSWAEFFETIWARIIIDCLVWLSPAEVVVIDYKTGKRFGNEIKHGKQMQLYQLATFMRYPEVQLVHPELWYLDQNEISPAQSFTRKQGLKFFDDINRRALEMTNARWFPANPSKHNCKFCPYQTGENKWIIGTGHCDANPRE